MTKNSLYILGGIIIVALIAVALWTRPSIAPAPSSTSTTTNPITGATSTGSTASTTTAIPVTVEYQHIGKWDAATAPAYKTPINFSGNLSADVKAQINASLAKAQAAIAADPHTFTGWINLGTAHKMGGDYTFAATIWEYMAKVFPTSETPFFNLASLYDYQLKDYPKAEADYLQASKNNPGDTTVYHDLSVLYEYKYKTDTNLAETILQKGISLNPGAYDLQVSLAEYYVRHGRTAEAKTEYQAAIANAKRQGFTSVAASIQADLDKLQ